MPTLTLAHVETQLVTTRPQWQVTLPALLPPDKFLSLTLLCLRQTPRLLECTEESLMAGIYQAARDGLELGTDAYLIPFKREATYVRSYSGIIKQLMRAGARKAFAEVVYEADTCTIDYGDTARPLTHRPALSKRGRALGAYGAIELSTGALLVHYMDKDDIARVRAQAPGKDADAWVQNEQEMWRKTALRNCAKYAALLHDEPEGDDAPPPPDPVEAARTVTMFSRSATATEAAAVTPTPEGRAQMDDLNAQRQEALKPYRVFLDFWRGRLSSDQLNAIATHVTGSYCALLPTTPVPALLAGHGDLARWHAWLEAQEAALLEQASAHALVDAFLQRDEVSHATAS